MSVVILIVRLLILLAGIVALVIGIATPFIHPDGATLFGDNPISTYWLMVSIALFVLFIALKDSVTSQDE